VSAVPDAQEGVAWDGIDRYMILSSDTHAGAELRQYKQYLDPRWHEDFDAWADSITNPFVDLRDPERAKLNWDSGARLAASDAEGITGEVIFPNTLPPFFDILAHLSGVPRDREQYERKWAGLQAHNRWLVDFCNGAPLRRRGLLQVLPNDLDAAVAEIRWAATTGVIGGVMIPAIPPNHPVEPFFHPRYDVLWATCAELGLAVHQHQGSGSPDVGQGTVVGQAVFFAELDLWTRRTLLHLVMGGVFERHPRLRVVWTEMWGIRWALEELDRIEKRLVNLQSRYAGDPRVLNYSSTFGSPIVDGLSLTPREYFARNCYLGASMLPRHEVRYRYALGVDRLMWGDDFPHDEGTTGHTPEGLRATLYDVPVAECRQMLAGVAARVYGFDLDALTPVAARIGPSVREVHTPLTERPVSRGEAFAVESTLEEAALEASVGSVSSS
jgi:predicted TIM-barrel fold metal-dependent hydrolase